MLRVFLMVALVAGTASTGPVLAGERQGGISDRPSVGQPLRFRAANGGAFQPSELVVVIPGGAVRAPLPEAALSAQDEDRVDLSGTPVVGGLFRETLTPADASEGTEIGPVFRRGDRLVVDAMETDPDITSRPVVLTSHLPRLGTVSYNVGRLRYLPGGGVLRGSTDQIGTAYLVGGQFVIAAEGGGSAWPSVEALVRDLFD